MKEFVFIFRTSKRVLSEEEQEQRRDWALALREGGRKLDPRILGEESYRVTEDGVKNATSPGGEVPVAAILFIEAADFNEALTLAKSRLEMAAPSAKRPPLATEQVMAESW